MESERKREVQEARKTLKEIGFKEFFITPTIEYWKAAPLTAFLTLFKWAAIMYLIMSLGQAIYFDTIYCDADDDQFDGKVMYVMNPYIELINKEIKAHNDAVIGTPYSIQEQPFKLERKIVCEHDFKRWIQEPFEQKTESIGYNFGKILLKKS